MKLNVWILNAAALICVTLAQSDDKTPKKPAQNQTNQDKKPGDQPVACQLVCPQNYIPICGQNDYGNYRLFGNECVLNQYNCQYRETYRKVDDKKCERPICLDTDKPVCATNGRKYELFKNICKLRVYNCQHKRKFRAISDASLCHDIWIPTVPPQTQCPDACPAIYKPTCAYNGRQYVLFGNPCELDVHNCKYNDNYRNVNDLSKCECPPIACTREYNPVCATNGIDAKLYGNLCMLRSANCNFKHGILPINQKFCLDRPPVCPIDPALCGDRFYPVCALSSSIWTRLEYKLLDNPCEVKLENCNLRNNVSMVIANINECKQIVQPAHCQSELCSDYQYNPICGMNYHTGKVKWFSSECALRLYNCIRIDNKLDAFQKTHIANCQHL